MCGARALCSWDRGWRDGGFATIRLIRDQVAGEEFEHAFRSSDERRHVQSNVDRAGKQAFLLDLVTRQTKSEDRSDDRNRFDNTFRKAPSAGSNDSAFHRAHIRVIRG